MQALEKFKGVTVAFYAPYDEKGEVSVAGAVAQARFYRDRGVRGLYLNGSSGEGFLLNLEERKTITEAVCREVGGQLSLIVHVGAAATRESVELARHAATCGADALSAVPSVYYRLSEASIEHHWSAMVDATDLPFLIYNIPQLTGYDLSLDLLKRMIRNPKVIGVKNSSMSTLQTEQFKKAGGQDFLVFNGPDEQYLAGRIMGAEAGIGGTYGAMPELFLHLERCFVEGRIAEAQKWQVRINEAIMELVSYPNLYSAAKEILRLRGVNLGSVRAPFLPLAPADLPKVKALHDKIVGWIAETQA